MKRIQLFIAGLFSLLLVLTSAALIAPSFINWQNNKGFIEELISKYTGYKINIQGELQVQVLPNIKIYAGDVVVHPTVGSQPLANINHVIITKNISEVLSADFTVGSLVINRPQVTLNIAKDGNSNWEPIKIKGGSFYAQKIRSITDNAGFFRNVKVDNATINYIDDVTEKTAVYSNVYFRSNNADIANIDTSLSYTFADKNIEISSSFDISNKTNIRMISRINKQDYKVLFQGFIKNPYRFSETELLGKIKLSLQTPESLNFLGSQVKQLTNYIELKNSEIEADFSISQNKFSVSSMVLNSDLNSFKGSLEYSKQDDKKELSLNIDAERAMINKVQIKQDNNNKEYGWSDDLLDFSFLNDYSITTNIKCTKCIYGDNDFEEVGFRAGLENNNLVVNQFNIKTDRDGFLKLSATAGLNKIITFEIKAELEKVDVVNLLRKLNPNLNAEIDVTGKLIISGKGSSVKTLMSSLTGNYNIQGDMVKFYSVDSKNTAGLLSTILTSKKGSDTVELKDVKMSAVIRDGVLRSSDLDFVFNNILTIAKGKVDLANLTANYRVEPTKISRSNLGVVVRGSINDLQILSDKVTPKGVIDDYGRVISVDIVKEVKRKEINTPFDFNDKANLESNVRKFLFEE